MKVSNTTQNLVNQTYGNQQNRAVADTNGKARKPREESALDNVSLSGKTQDIRKVNAAMQAYPSNRTEKVADLKKSVEEGTYTVNAEKVAEKMAGNFLQEII